MSAGEDAFALHCTVEKISFIREHAFCPGRRWRFDFYFPQAMLAVEVEGGTWNGGRHSRGAGFEKDCEKYNRAAIMGIRVLRFSTRMVTRGEAIETLLEALG